MKLKKVYSLSFIFILVSTIYPFTVLPFNLVVSSIRFPLIISIVISLTLISLKLLYFNKVSMKVSLVRILMILFFFSLIIGVVNSLDIKVSFFYFIWLLTIVLFLYTLINYNNYLYISKSLLESIYYLSIVITILNVFYNIMDSNAVVYRGNNVAFKGIFNNNNTTGMIFLWICISLMIYKEVFYRYKPILINILIICSTFLLFASSSRSSILSYIIFYLLFLLIKKKFILVGLFFSFLLIVFTFFNDIVFQFFRISSNSSTTLLGERSYLLNYVLNSITDIPFWGLGIGMQEQLWFVSDYIIGSNPLNYLSFHNSFLQIYIEVGVIGFAAFFLFNIGIIYMTFKNKDGSDFLKLLGIGLLAFLINGFFESSLFLPGSPITIIYWTYIFLILSYQSNLSRFKEDHFFHDDSLSN